MDRKFTLKQAASILAKRGASKGGKARAAKLSPRRRKKIARDAARARWARARAQEEYEKMVDHAYAEHYL